MDQEEMCKTSKALVKGQSCVFFPIAVELLIGDP